MIFYYYSKEQYTGFTHKLSWAVHQKKVDYYSSLKYLADLSQLSLSTFIYSLCAIKYKL
jgi:hypothetical protein